MVLNSVHQVNISGPKKLDLRGEEVRLPQLTDLSVPLDFRDNLINDKLMGHFSYQLTSKLRVWRFLTMSKYFFHWLKVVVPVFLFLVHFFLFCNEGVDLFLYFLRNPKKFFPIDRCSLDHMLWNMFRVIVVLLKFNFHLREHSSIIISFLFLITLFFILHFVVMGKIISIDQFDNLIPI